MFLREGKGYLIRAAMDAPWAGWTGSRFLEEGLASVHAAPGRALYRLMKVSTLLPGGFALIWDHPPIWMKTLTFEARQGWWEALSGVPGVSLHVQTETALDLPGGALRAWVHTQNIPQGPLGERWRNGVIGWVSQLSPQWSLPGLGHTSGEATEDIPSSWLWGEVLLPVGALAFLISDATLPSALAETQAQVERGLAQRLLLGAWPQELPFLRKDVGWRLGLLGGADFQRANGSWDQAALHLAELMHRLTERLRVPIYAGSCEDPFAASLLGRQAMREALPWRMSLPLPPSPPSFALGLAGDPREASPLLSRIEFPFEFQRHLSHPSVALLRVPAVPAEDAVEALFSPMNPLPAIRWIPPELPPPAPYDPDLPWAPAHTYPLPTNPRAGVQQGLFEQVL